MKTQVSEEERKIKSGDLCKIITTADGGKHYDIITVTDVGDLYVFGILLYTTLHEREDQIFEKVEYGSMHEFPLYKYEYFTGKVCFKNNN